MESHEDEDEDEWETIKTVDDSSEIIHKVESCAPMYGSAPMYESAPMFERAPMYERFKMYESTYEKAIPKKDVPKKNPVNNETVVANPIINDWSMDAFNTVSNWRDDISKSSFIYSQLLDKKEFYLQLILVLTLILSTFMTILAGISVALGSLSINVQWVLFTFNIIILVSSGTVTALNGIVKIFSLDDQIKSLTKIVEKLDNQWFVFETELSIPPEQRQNAKDFIKRSDGDYMHLMQNCPHVSINDYVKSNKTYQERLAQNLIWQHQFRKQVEEQLK